MITAISHFEKTILSAAAPSAKQLSPHNSASHRSFKWIIIVRNKTNNLKAFDE
jgi:hypothetical protein